MIFHTKASSPVSFKQITNITREGDGLWEKCNQCGLVMNRRGILPEKVNEYYNKKYRNSTISPQEQINIRTPSIFPVYEYLKPYLNKETRLLELGCGAGELLQLLNGDVGYCFGIELNTTFIDFINDELDIDGTNQDYYNLHFDSKFDIIVSLYTIDHIYNTLETLEKIYNDLELGGLFYLELPNDEQALRTNLPEPTRSNFKQFMYQEAHYYSFTFKFIIMILEQIGFNIKNSFSRHAYTLINFLNWYFTGQPQQQFLTATTDKKFFLGNNEFETEMNNLFIRMESEFQSILGKNRKGESICILAQKR